jgi:competence protein ComEC
MVGLVLVAVLVDRMAISMRLAAWAAAIVLVISPYSLLGPSFQMSFAAVIALIAGYEALRDRLAGWRSRAGPGRMALLYLSGVMLSTAIASTATAPFALFHFQQFASYGLATNLLAVPLTALWIMPWGLAAYLLMPLGLEALALVPMGLGISALLAIAETASGWTHAVLRVAAPPGWALGVAALGGLWLCLWRGRWRLWGMAGVAAGLIGLVWPQQGPDILISEDGRLMAVRASDGRLAISSMRIDRFTRDIWLRADGRPEAIPWPTARDGGNGPLTCDPLACLYRRDGLVVALIRDPRALQEDCAIADIVVASVPVPRFCGARIIVDRFDVWRHGAYAITLSAAASTIDRVSDGRGGRPWQLDRRPAWERAEPQLATD